MRSRILVGTLFILLALASAALATNGDNLIAIGPIARSMGGVGIAAPQDAISAVFANPAAMCFSPYCPSSEVDFAGTVFMPHPKASIKGPASSLPPGFPSIPAKNFSADADEKIYPIPAIGLSYPLSNSWPFWRLGLAAYGVSGLGVDYRDTNIERSRFFQIPLPDGGTQFAPLATGTYTSLQIMKFAPTIAAQLTERFSVGASLQIDYSTLDLGEGSQSAFGLGTQIGMIYKLGDHFSAGLSYVSPQNISYDDIAHLDQNNPGEWRSLDLEMPQQIGIGLAYTTLDNKLLLETDVKWINWADAAGYEDFDWDNQWVFALGAQYFVTPKLSVRAGYNYGANPVKEHQNWSSGSESVVVQGSHIPRYFYETFRVIGFPAVVEHHLTLGAGYQFTPKVGVHIGYMHAFENEISETGPDIFGTETTIKSKLSEDSIDFALTWRF